MTKPSLNQTSFYMKTMKTGRLFCSFLLLVGLLLVTGEIFAQNAGNPAVVIEDVDGDGLKDASIQTDVLTVIISSKTGSPSVYYLKGGNYEENLFPPVIQDLGYKIASETIRPFTTELRGLQLQDSGYTIELDEKNQEQVIIKATANVSLANAESDAATGLSLAKRFTFVNNGYHFKVEHVVTNLKEKLVTVGDEKNGGLTFNFGPGLFMDPFGPATLLGLKQEQVETIADAAALNKAGEVAGAFNGIGLRDQYFCVLLETGEMAKISATAYEFSSEDQRRKKHPGHVISCALPSFNLGARESRTFVFQAYAGPIILDQLTKIGRGQVSEYGFLSTILLRILQFFYALFPNYGLAIILLTVVVRLVLYPLTLKQTKSMAKMQKIQPKVQDLKDRYKDNPQKFNEEVLKLYQKNDVNPLGGCLPLLLQLPILIALYNTIRIAVELRKTPFLWIADLSKGDPLLILPIAIAALMYYQQGKMTDPNQQQMMAFMPMFMFVITWSLPAGLLVYWFASSVIGLLQQFQANRIAAALKEE
jgi:YidC/Oxa1 family membrane protein insertase